MKKNKKLTDIQTTELTVRFRGFLDNGILKPIAEQLSEKDINGMIATLVKIVKIVVEED